MDFLKQYLKIISYSLLGLVFAFASFYLLANLYHYLEIRKDYVADFSNHPIVTDIDKSLVQIQANINKFNSNTYSGSIPTLKMQSIKQNIEACLNSINNEEYRHMKSVNRISILDVYKLRETYENEVYNKCIVTNLYWLTELENINDSYLNNNKELTKYYFDTLKSLTSYLKKDLINNSSYYYNTSIVSASIKDNTKDGYYDVMDAYTKATNFVLYLSNWYRMEVGA